MANPTKSVSSGKPDERGKVVAEGSVPAQREWLQRHAQAHGFRVAPGSFDVTRSEWKVFFKGMDHNRRVSLLQVTYEGVLEVTDAARFLETLSQGMGRAKAYGLGMMTVIRHMVHHCGLFSHLDGIPIHDDWENNPEVDFSKVCAVPRYLETVKDSVDRHLKRFLNH